MAVAEMRGRHPRADVELGEAGMHRRADSGARRPRDRPAGARHERRQMRGSEMEIADDRDVQPFRPGGA